MTPISLGIAAAIFGLKLLTSKDVITAAKQLTFNINNKPISGVEKKAYVLSELEKFFGNIVPIILGAVIEMVVLDMQNKDGTLQTKIKEMESR